MKSGKKKKFELKRKRALKKENERQLAKLGVNTPIAADHSKLNSPSCMPRFPIFYYDVSFACRGCGSNEVWTPKQQKWWYEIIGGNIETTAIYCRPCRIKRRLIKSEARRGHLEGLAKKRGNA
ncbi:zinc-ribbon domain containing protein [Agarivorans aestuarii]|uniref:Zinc-ribbon domain containing protein n=1 Tax=Agarivorans aestuarii TaxID=1563703 RepID=A0ABU7G250_9ALTE|nr:zinc-ribbon domain containing protein [Agarivorans aestuarii]MEE1673396.1 zinc-ribbon domain containing protein [Agarivorans aestuarii]